MKVLIDICHPAHVHFFKNIILILQNNDHDVLITSRDKDVTLKLLDQLSIEHRCLSKAPKSKSIIGLFKELIHRNYRLFQVSRKFQPDIMIAIGGIFIAHVGMLTKAQTIACYDTENATLQNLLTYPFIDKLLVPDAYKGWTPKKRTVRYNGYHELSYLHADLFQPNKEIASKNGICLDKDNFLLRIVSWNANHDINEAGWTNDFLDEIIKILSIKGNIIISSERLLPEQYKKYIYQGDPNELHHVLAFCDLYVGESATIASEAAVLGIPAIYIANTSRGYIDEQEKKYYLVKVIKTFNIDHIRECIFDFLTTDKNIIHKRHNYLKQETLNVADFVYKKIYNFYRTRRN